MKNTYPYLTNRGSCLHIPSFTVTPTHSTCSTQPTCHTNSALQVPHSERVGRTTRLLNTHCAGAKIKSHLPNQKFVRCNLHQQGFFLSLPSPIGPCTFRRWLCRLHRSWSLCYQALLSVNEIWWNLLNKTTF